MPEYEVMEDGKTGLVFKEDSVEDLGRIIKKLLMDENGRKEMSRYARMVAYERYSMENMISNFSLAIDCAMVV